MEEDSESDEVRLVGFVSVFKLGSVWEKRLKERKEGRKRAMKEGVKLRGKLFL